MKRILPALLLLLALPAQAEIYKWVDEKGRTHFGEVLPEKYRKSGKVLDPQPMNTISTGEMRRGANSAPSPAATPDTRPPAPPRALNAEELCVEQHQKYRQSQECFARFRNANGSLKAGAAEQCGENIPQPTCTPAR